MFSAIKINLFYYQLDAVQTANVKIPKFVQTGSAWMLAWQTTHVQATPSATPPTTSLPADVPPASRVTPMSTASEWSVASTRTAPRTRPALTTSAPTPASTITRVPHQPLAQSRTTWPSARVPLAGWATPWCPAHPSWSQTFSRTSPSVSLTEIVLMTPRVLRRSVPTPVTRCHRVT